MIVDIGGGTTDIAVIALSGIVCDQSIRVAGDTFNRDILDYMRRQLNLRDEQVVNIFADHGNQVGASLPFALHTAVASGRLRRGDTTLMLGTSAGAASPHDVLYFYWGQELHAVRSGRWKLHLPHPYQSLEAAGADGAPGKYVRKGEHASNGVLVERAVEILQAMNVRILGPGEVREKLGLRQGG